MTGLMKKIPFAIDTFKALVGAITFQDVADDGRTGHAESAILRSKSSPIWAIAVPSRTSWMPRRTT